MTPDEYFETVPALLQPVAAKLVEMFNYALPDCKTKVWHSIPVWFQEGNPIVTYFVKKDRILVMFWNGQKFDQGGLKPVGKYSAADIGYSSLEALDEKQLAAWLIEARDKPQTDLAMRVKV
jgi:hypothetical protein